MIVTEPGLTWRRAAVGDSAGGGSFTQYQCVEHPRLKRLVQRPNRDAEYTEVYCVEGIAAQFYHTPTEALIAMRANP